MDKLFVNSEDCCGCTACMSACPKQAISMIPDEEGFLYPKIDESLCINCELCKNVCAFQRNLGDYDTSRKPLMAFAGVLKDTLVLRNSASGGAFISLTFSTLNNNGVVFGCTLNKNKEAEHIYVDKIKDIGKLQGSKYVQSDIKDSFIKVKQNLKENRQVLFSGTPCQIAGLNSYLKKNYDNLLTVDLICHGVPSPLFFKGYINWLEDQLKATIIDFKFRDKKKGWSLTAKIIYKRNNKLHEKIIYPFESYYYYYFLKGDISRKSCYVCPYANSSRVGDVTIGDFWGINNVHPEINDEKGVSLILINTKKGLKKIDSIKKYMNLTGTDFEQAKLYNGQLEHPIAKSKKRDMLYTKFRIEGASTIANEYYKEMKNQIVFEKIKARIPPPIKNMIKEVLKRT